MFDNVIHPKFTLPKSVHGWSIIYGPLVIYVKLRVVHAPGMPWTFSTPPGVSDPEMHHGTCMSQVPWCMPGSLISSFIWSLWPGKRSRHSRRMPNPQFYVSGKRPMTTEVSVAAVMALMNSTAATGRFHIAQGWRIPISSKCVKAFIEL